MTMRLSQRALERDRVIELVSAEESAGELFRFEYIARTFTPAPREHVHTQQEERVEVLEGTLRCRVGGVEYRLRPRETITIPAGTPHVVWNDDPAGSR